MSNFAAINAAGPSDSKRPVVAGFRLLLCAVVALLPFLSAPAQASLETSHHMHMSHDMGGHNVHHGSNMEHDMMDHGDCCETSDICVHDECTMNGFQAFGLLKTAESGLAHAMRLSWTHDTIAQRDGHRPLLDPPIP